MASVSDVTNKTLSRYSIILKMWSCYQSLVTLEFNMREVFIVSVYKDLTRKTNIFEKCSWFMSLI